MRRVGHDQMRASMKWDNEPAIVDLVERFGKLMAVRGARPTMIENTAAYASASNAAG